jgi:CBS domain containing-hemolysin-like protein
VTLTIELAAVALLVLLNAFFVAAEYGLVTARRTRILELEHQGSRRARAVLRIVADPPRFIAAMQLGVTLTSLAIGALGESALTNALDPIMAGLLAVFIAFLVITFMHVVIGELVPKGVALGHSEATALAVSAPVRAFFILFRPLIWVLQRSTEVVLRLLGLEPPGAESDVHSEAELRMLVSQSTEHGEIEQNEQEMLYKVFDFADKEASDVMVPRPEVVALSIDLPPEECLEAVMDSPYTRYPVYRGSLDDIVGILHVRDLFSALRDRGMSEVRVEELVRPAHMVPETKDLAALLTEFRRLNQHMAVVIDEYGAMEGIVTLEDLLEEIVGEIEDEFDLPDESVEQVDDDTIRIDGTFPIDDFNERFHTSLPDEDYNTVAGFVFGLLGRTAEPGDSVSHDGLRFDVLEVDGQRLKRLEVMFERQRDLRERGEADAAADDDAAATIGEVESDSRRSA